MQPLLAVARLTLKAAFRNRLVLVLLVLLMGAVIILPSIIKHDGSAQGFTQILITYTLGAIITLLGFSTLWLACGSLAREVEDFSMQLVCTKPVARWQVWLGKWLGIMMLNAGLLAVSGGMVYVLLLSKSSSLKPEQQKILQEEVLVARKSAREVLPDPEPTVERLFQERIRKQAVAALNDRAFVRKQIREQVVASMQYLRPGQARRWIVNLGPDAAVRLKDRPLFLRVKFFTPDYAGSNSTFDFGWEIGPPEGHKRQRFANNLAPESFISFEIEGNHIAPDGTLTVDGVNLNDRPVLFLLEDGFEVLYHEGGFGLNFVRGLGILFCWLGLLCAIGLFAASKLQFNVAVFVSFGILLVGLSSGTLKQVVEQGGIVGVSSEEGIVVEKTILNNASVIVYGTLRAVIDQVTGFSPVDSLSSGRSITWTQLFTAAAVVIGITGGVFAAAGIWIFTRRELAAPQ